MDTLQQVKLDKIENLLQVLVNLLDKRSDTNQLEIMTQKGSPQRTEYFP